MGGSSNFVEYLIICFSLSMKMAVGGASNRICQIIRWTSGLTPWLWHLQTFGTHQKQMIDTISAIFLCIPQGNQCGADHGTLLNNWRLIIQNINENKILKNKFIVHTFPRLQW